MFYLKPLHFQLYKFCLTKHLQIQLIWLKLKYLELRQQWNDLAVFLKQIITLLNK